MQTALTEPAIDLRGRLLADHYRLDQLFAEVQAAFEEDEDPRELRRLWTQLDDGLTAHMRAEEEYILPEFARVDAAEAAGLRAEHDDLRRRLTELGVGLDLHVLNARAAREFLDGLRKHASREDALLYRWAQLNVEPEVRTTLLSRLRVWSSARA